ncbi:MAG: type II toxin-antitoxin system HicA family toxin [Candidatus Saccharimonadales bacterium]
MPKLLPSKEIVKVLERNGFVFVSQNGSPAKYRKDVHTTIVPAGKKAIPLGTFKSIVRQSGLDPSVFTKRPKGQ